MKHLTESIICLSILTTIHRGAVVLANLRHWLEDLFDLIVSNPFA